MFIWRCLVAQLALVLAGMAILSAVLLVPALAGMATSLQFWADRLALVPAATVTFGADRLALALAAMVTFGADRPALALVAMVTFGVGRLGPVPAATEISYSFTNALRGMAAPDRSV
jgi:hypothetical protein